MTVATSPSAHDIRGHIDRIRARDILVMSRPRFWLASAVAVHVGFVLATRRVLPRGDEFLTMAHVALVAGPLLWLAVLAFNDAHDLDSDRLNPRKARSPLVQGRLMPRQATRIGLAASLLAVLVAVPLGALFASGVAATLLLAWAYSAPPLRLKARAGADVLVNAAAVGVVGPLGGWVAMRGSTDGFPWPIAVIGLLAAAALYLPTTIADRDADAAVGIRTTAVVLGSRVTLELGFALWLASAVLALACAVADVVVSPSLVPLHLVIMPILLVLYRRLLTGRPSFAAITVVAGAYLVPCAAFVITYVDSI
ncbi:UbiA family prenyltransferase [Phytoactinopolyspora halotolerans]|uniref:UbiA family prenyltransferase n=1 Tax=Phytoactinopolyspora halotolerans TaxID=1981512 RepID=A0A6L9SBP8_9ACTN|nr:UbiA family prenyltransferase [Phytoactinopolyspora halotolerans]NEE01938.1 UbiA family prenyltransferase [Phytoactinopolyspora halotolerans]